MKLLYSILCVLFLSSCGYCGTLGYTATTGSDDSGDSSYFTGHKVSPAVNCTMTSMSIYAKITTGTGHVRLALYTNDTADNQNPVSLISGSDTGAITVSNTDFAWLQSDALNVSLTAGTTYWIAFQPDDDNIHFIYNSGAAYSGYQIGGQSYASFPPSTAPTGGEGATNYSAYLTYSEGEGEPAATSVPVSNILIFSRLTKSVVFL